MLTPHRRDSEYLIRRMRSRDAQHHTDIQRLWRRVERVQRETQEVIGGYPINSSPPTSGGIPDLPYPTPTPWTPPDDGESDSASGGPGDTGPGPDCCLWLWDGSAWIKIIDNTDGCECPEPEDDGTEINETTVTCCPSCEVTCGARTLSCTLELTYANVGAADALRDALAGSYTLTWNGVDAWVSQCRVLPNVAGIFNSTRVSVPCPAGIPSPTYTYATFDLFLAGNCGGGSAAQTYGPLNETNDAPYTFECNDVAGCVDVQITIVEA